MRKHTERFTVQHGMVARNWLGAAVATVVAAMIWAADPAGAQAPGSGNTEPEDRYVEFFFIMREAESLERQGDVPGAYNQYGRALGLIQAIARDAPGWKQDVVDYRTKFCRDKVRALEPLARKQRSDFPESMPPGTPPSPPPPPMFQNMPAPPALPPGPPEAATALPSPRNEAEFLRMREYAEGLKRELDLTKSDLDLTKAQLDEVRKERADMESRIAAFSERMRTAKEGGTDEQVAAMVAENRLLQDKLRGLEAQIAERQGTSGQMEQAFSEMRAKVDAARQELDVARQEKASYAAQVAALQTQLKALQKYSEGMDRGGGPDVEMLKRENQMLRSVVMRQLNEHARRVGIGRDLLGAVRQLEVKPAGLEENVAMLADNAVPLTAEEGALLGIVPTPPDKADGPTAASDVAKAAPAPAPAVPEASTPAPAPAKPPPAETPAPADSKTAKAEVPAAPPVAVPAPMAEGGAFSLTQVMPGGPPPLEAGAAMGAVLGQGPQVEAPQVRTEEPARPAESGSASSPKASSDVLPMPEPATPVPPVSPVTAGPIATDAGSSRPPEPPAPMPVPAPEVAVPTPVPVPEAKAPAPIATAPAPVVAASAGAGVGGGKPPEEKPAAGSSEDKAMLMAIPPDMKNVADEAGRLFSKGMYDDAAAQYEQILARYPKNVYALSNLAVVRFQQRKFNEAEIYLKQAVAIMPEDDFSHSILGVIYYHDERIDDALAMLLKAEELNPRDARTQKYLHLIYQKKGLQKEAERALARAREIDPNL